MQDKQQFDQLMLQYNQLKNGSEEIHHLIQKEDFDTAMTMLKSREALFLNCKCMRKYLELTPDQEQELNTLLEEIKTLNTNQQIEYVLSPEQTIQLIVDKMFNMYLLYNNMSLFDMVNSNLINFDKYLK